MQIDSTALKPPRVALVEQLLECGWHSPPQLSPHRKLNPHLTANPHANPRRWRWWSSCWTTCGAAPRPCCSTRAGRRRGRPAACPTSTRASLPRWPWPTASCPAQSRWAAGTHSGWVGAHFPQPVQVRLVQTVLPCYAAFAPIPSMPLPSPTQRPTLLPYASRRAPAPLHGRPTARMPRVLHALLVSGFAYLR